MAGTTPVHHSSISYLQDQDIRGQLHSGRSHLTDDPGIINQYLQINHTTLQINDTTRKLYDEVDIRQSCFRLYGWKMLGRISSQSAKKS